MASLGRALTSARPDVNVRTLVGNHGQRKGHTVVLYQLASLYLGNNRERLFYFFFMRLRVVDTVKSV